MLQKDLTISQDIKELKNISESRLIKFVFLVAKKVATKPKSNSYSFYLPLEIIKSSEQQRFLKLFSEKYSHKKLEFNKIIENNYPNEISPFFFGLIAFEEKYISLKDFVTLRIQKLTAQQKKLLLFIAFTTYYGEGKENLLPSYFFKTLLKSKNEFLILQNHIENKFLLDLIIEVEPLKWRTLHHLIAKQILIQIFKTNETEEINPYELENLSLEFISICKDISSEINDEILNKLRSIYIFRDNSIEEVEDEKNTLYNPKSFSKLITDLKYNDKRITVLKKLSSFFGNKEPHFFAHLSRLYSYNQNFDLAKNAIDEALETFNLERTTSQEHYTFNHIKGMIFRNQFYQIKAESNINSFKSNEFEKAKEYFSNAEIEFIKVIKLVPQKEYGYIAYVQMVIQLLNFGFSIYNIPNKTFTKFLTNPSNEWFREKLDLAQNFLNDLEVINAINDENSEQLEFQKRLLQKFYDDPENIINSWYGLLSNDKFNKNLIRRQIIKSYFSKYNFDINKISKKDLERIETYLKDNLKNSPEIVDIRNYMRVERILNRSKASLISTLQNMDFLSENVESAFYLYSLYTIESIEGVVTSAELANEFKLKCSKRAAFYNSSKIFCPEWVGINNSNLILLNSQDIGKWNKEKSFFEDNVSLNKLARLSGKVKRIENKSKGYIEFANGIDIFYIPAKANHFKSDENKTVEFYLGFNYNGPIAFEVKNK